MKYALGVIIFFCVHALHAQTKVEDLEKVLNNDSTLSIYKSDRLVINKSEIINKGTRLPGFWGKYRLDSMKNNYGAFDIIVNNSENGNVSLLFEFIKKSSDYYLGNLSFFESIKKSDKAPDGISILEPVSGIAWRNDSIRYTLFFRMSGRGLNQPVRIRTDKDSVAQQTMNTHSILKNDLEDVYLFDAYYNLKGIYSLHNDVFEVVTIEKKVKLQHINVTQKQFENFSFGDFIERWNICAKEGEVIDKFSLPRDYLTQIYQYTKERKLNWSKY